MHDTLGNLRAVRARIARPQCWTRGALARNAEGFATGPTRPDAVSWCLVGAIYAAAGSTQYDEATVIARMLTSFMNDQTIRTGEEPFYCMVYNDRRSHAEVLALLDRAIEAERARRRQRTIDALKAAASAADDLTTERSECHEAHHQAA